MKRFLGILVVLGIALVMPMVAKAAETAVTFNCEKECVSAGDKCQQTCTLGITGDISTISTFSGTLELSDGLTVESITAANGWTSSSVSPILAFSTNTALTGTNTTIATIKINVPKDAKDCSVGVKAGTLGTATVELTTTTEVVTTGATLPIVIISIGALAAAFVFIVSKKNTKMYKI